MSVFNVIITDLTIPIKISPTQLSEVHSLNRLWRRAMNPLLNARILCVCVCGGGGVDGSYYTHGQCMYYNI